MTTSVVSLHTFGARRESAHDAAPCISRRADPDSDVLALVGSGDVKAALGRVMERHGTTVYRYCRAALHDPTLADDVQQQVFVEVFRDFHRFQGRSTLRAWLFAIARNRVLDAAKARRRAPVCCEDGAADDRPDLRPSAGESIDEGRLVHALVCSVAALDDKLRTAVLLRYQQGFTFDEMAEICGEKPGTLAARVARALPVLRAAIEARMRSPP